MARNSGSIEIGKLADLVAINCDHHHFCNLTDHQIFDGLCFVADDDVITDVWSAGRHIVTGGRHKKREEIIKAYRYAISELKNHLTS